MKKYVLNIMYDCHPHTSIVFDTYDEAEDYIADIYDNQHYDGSITHWKIIEVEV